MIENTSKIIDLFLKRLVIKITTKEVFLSVNISKNIDMKPISVVFDPPYCKIILGKYLSS